jgi:hypothetical protein
MKLTRILPAVFVSFTVALPGGLLIAKRYEFVRQQYDEWLRRRWWLLTAA